MIHTRLQFITRQSSPSSACSLARQLALSFTVLSTVVASLVGGPVLRATARTQPQAIAAPLAGTYGSSASYAGALCVGLGVPPLVPSQNGNANGAPDGSFASLLGLNCQLTVNFATPQTGNVRVYAVSTVALDVAPTVQLLDVSNTVLQTFTGLAGLAVAGSPTATLIYTGTTAYSKIRFSNLATVGTGGIDAVEALPDPPTPADVYGDFAQNFGSVCTNLLGANPDAALGVPDAVTAALGIGVNCTLRVDLGKGETGTGPLRIYSRALVAASGASSVTLRDSTGNVLQTFNSVVDLNAIGAQTTTLIYTGTTPYRFVDFTGLAGANIGGIDAVETLADPPLPVDVYGDYAQNIGGVLCTSILGNGAGNVTGAPDGLVAALNLGVGCTLRVDLGSGEEGSGNLRIFSQAIASLGAASTVTLRDSAGNLVRTYASAIDLTTLGAQTTTLIYTGTTPYRFIDFGGLTSLSAGGIDAVQILPDPPLPPDPYADAGQQTGSACVGAGNSAGAEGAPDGQTAVLGLGVNCTLLLDMGRLEEGVGNLTVHYAGLAAVGASALVDLLDVNGNVLAQSGSLLQLNLAGPQTATLVYTGTTPYRFVRVSNLAGIGLASGVVDAVVAQSYNNGDTDGDGLPTNCPTPGADEECGGDPDGDGLPNHSDNDEDGDGIPTFCPVPGPGQECKGDQDLDGILDYLDNDSLNNTDTRKVAPAAVQGGSLLTYSLVLSNSGAVPLTLIVEDSVPAPLQIQGTSPAASSQTGNKLIWSNVVVNAGEILTLTVNTLAPTNAVTYSVSNIFSATLPPNLFLNKFVLGTPAVTFVTVDAFDPNGDDDGDGIINGDELPEDTDGDGTPNYKDNDDDGDGILTQCPVAITGECAGDADSDGIVDYLDNDSLNNADSTKMAVRNGNRITYTLVLSNPGAVPLTPIIQDTELNALLTVLGSTPAVTAQTGDNDLVWTGLTIPAKQTLTLVVQTQYPVVGGPTVTLTNRFMATLGGSFRNNQFVSNQTSTVIPGTTATDDDGDGIPNDDEDPGDGDDDGTPDVQDPDDDGDGIPTQCPIATLGTECMGDEDNDGIVDYLDNDSLRNAESRKTARATAAPSNIVTYTLVLSNSGAVTLTPTIVDDVPARLIVAGSAPPATAQTGNKLTWMGLSIAPKARLTLVITTVATASVTPYTVTNNFTATLPASFKNNVFVPAIPAVTQISIGNNTSPDDDGDGIPNDEEQPGDTDNDGTDNVQDPDDDGDGIPTQCPIATVGTECMGDDDSDTIVDYLDNDSLRNGGSGKIAASTVQAGTLLTYSIVLRNVGAVALTPVVTDNVPVSLTILSTSPAASSQIGQQVVWSNVSVPAGGTITLTLVTRPVPTRSSYTVVNTFAATVFGGNTFMPVNGVSTLVTAGGSVNPSEGGLILYLPVIHKQSCVVDVNCRTAVGQ